jgi:hypothetical protein
MSSGPSDANAQGDLVENIFGAAYDLAQALKKARTGHRGWAVPVAHILKEVNDCLSETDFRLVHRER